VKAGFERVFADGTHGDEDEAFVDLSGFACSRQPPREKQFRQAVKTNLPVLLHFLLEAAEGQLFAAL
jgi:hypothetical protein